MKNMAVGYELERNRAYKLILDLIMAGEFEADSPLSERKLADALMMGRTPIREALRDLVRDEVLEALPARGTIVRKLSLRDIREIYEVRFAIEGMAARLASERGKFSELSKFRKKFEETIGSPRAFDVREVYEFGAEFHLAIFRASGNNQLYRIYQPLRLRFRLALGLPRHYDHDRVYTSAKEHLEVCRAIEARNPDEAEELLVKHLKKGLDTRTRIFNKLRKPKRNTVK